MSKRTRQLQEQLAQQQAQAQAAEAARAALEKQLQDQQAAAAKAEQDRVAAEQTRQADIQKFANEALAQGKQSLQTQGLGTDDWFARLAAEIDRRKGNLTSTDDPRTALGTDIADQLVNQFTTQKRNELSNQADQVLGPNYGERIISDNLLDNTIKSILDEQRGGAEQYVDRGYKRGIYNDTGRAAAEQAISNGYSTGLSDLSRLGSGVLDKYQSEADTIRDKAYSAINGYRPSQTFNFDDYLGQGNAVASRANTNAAGDLRSAVGGTNYFDFSRLNQSAGQAQGAVNLRDADVATALAERKRREGSGRGLGSQGVF